VFEEGQLLIRTNSSTPLTKLALLADFSSSAEPDWALEDGIDLTPYVGRNIQLVWEYVGVLVSQPHGWLIDDISITGTAIGGTININKNLNQARYSLYSLSNIGLVPVQSGQAAAVTISNLPSGPYVVQFSDVPYYQTPADLTNTLTATTTLYFNGNYSFLDANHNNISDAWEQDYFGSVSTNRTQLTDTDHDGMSDYAEFIAGTNPTNAASRFYFNGETIQTNRQVKLQWTVVTDRLYQVNASTNLLGWSSVTPWLQASNSPTMSYTVTNSNGRAQFYRVQVKP
jgi:hypothetical protein